MLDLHRRIDFNAVIVKYSGRKELSAWRQQKYSYGKYTQQFKRTVVKYPIIKGRK